MTDTRRGYHPDGTATHEADYFGNCSVCGAAIDAREFCQLLAHLHGAAATEVFLTGRATRLAPREGEIEKPPSAPDPMTAFVLVQPAN
jgi:hypothetical protein